MNESNNMNDFNEFMHNTDSNIKASMSCCDTSCLDLILEYIPYLEDIIKNPKRYIIQDGNIKPMKNESIKPLNKNTKLIQEVKEDGTLAPLRLLDVYEEETLDLYENRFIKSLIDKIYIFIENQENIIKNNESINKTYDYTGTYKNGYAKLRITFENEEKSRDLKGKNAFAKIDKIRKTLDILRKTPFIESMHDCSTVRSPIRKTNVILKEPNFIKALELWEYLEKNNSLKLKKTTCDENDFFKNKCDQLFYSLTHDEEDSKQESSNIDIYDGLKRYVINNEISESEFVSTLLKTYKLGIKEKEKVIVETRKKYQNYINEYEKRKKKALAILK